MEVKEKLFAARDKNGELYFYEERPKLREDGTFVGSTPLSDKKFLPALEKGTCVECTLVVEVNQK